MSTTEGQAPTWDDEASTRTFQHMFEMFFSPEIERRKQAGTLPDNFFLYMAQVLLPPDGRNTVLLNDEVKGVGAIRANRPIQAGEPITIEDFGRLEKFDLPDELLDNGHFTIVRSDDRWLMFFNFLSGRKKASDRLKLASEFLEAAQESARKGHSGPSIDNLYSATELTAKATLILNRLEAANSKTHRSVAGAFNKLSRHGNVDRAFVELFNRLGEQRPNARYADSEHRPAAPLDDDFELVAAVIEEMKKRVAKATDK